MKLIPNVISRKIAREILVAKKNSPHAFFAVGVVSVVAGAVLACRATLKLEETVDEIKKDLDAIPVLNGSSGDINHPVFYPTEQHYKDVGYIYAKSAIKIGKLYGPAIVVGGTGIALLTGSHVQLTKRNAALTVTLSALSKAYSSYRERVQEEIGEQRELELYRAVHEEVVEMDGHKQKISVVDPNGLSPYARFFDEYSPNWQKDGELNRIFLQCQQNYANHRLQAYGHVFLNEVYDMLGLERSRAGAVVGWIVDGDGDAYIDFGLFEARSKRFINNLEKSIILDFNVDGVIYDKIKEG